MTEPIHAASLSEYLLVTMPDEKTVNRLEKYQEYLVSNYYPQAERLQIRYLALTGLMAKDYLEETLSRWLMKVCRMKPAFTLSFDKNPVFRDGVLFLESVNSAVLRSFHLQLGVVDEFLTASDCAPLHLISKPQLPILIPNVPVLENSLAFEFEFVVSELFMLKRNMLQDRFEKIDVFGLSG